MMLTACTMTVKRHYLEPSGAGVNATNNVESVNDEAGALKTAGIIHLASDVTLQLQSHSNEAESVSLLIRLPPGRSFRFSHPTVVLRSGGEQATISPTWRVLVRKDGHVRMQDFPFDTELSESLERGVRKVERPPAFSAVIRLPPTFRNKPTFTLELPGAADGAEPVVVHFERKYAEYRQRVRQLQ
ncbi:MAG TPA: hypothetical protein VM029_22240 [Opitutaceae bacterium]|nr:hypothetical protein [Opitutaceae bacterium]